ncbi:hypothetical protein BDZ91DRAFT_483817 [Kalaharituber pfeilii]|nr:hypothetical protein BDZ91DRAFT_483817 [Kalaharituber pfeilii]
MKRLYNNHGSIKRPACVACHESRKKCDLERPCNRCIKQKIPCVERPERAKRRKLEFDKTVKPDWSRGHSSTVQIPHGLPSPVSEACNETVPSTPITSYIPCPSNCIASPSSAEPGVQCEFPLDKAKVESIIREQLSKLGLPYGDVLELPLPEGGYLENISSKLSGAPIYGIEGGEITDQDTLLHQLVEDISMDKPNDANFDCKDALGFANMLMDYKFDDIDINAILGSISTEDIKNCMDNVNGDVLMGGMEDWELSNFMDALETTSSADLTKQSTILDPCATNWSVE